MSTDNLHNKEAAEKIKELAESIDFALMGTALDRLPIHAIPMSTKKVDSEGKIWFLSGKDSDHNRHIKENPIVQLFYSNKGDMEFMTVFGRAVITDENQILKELYGKSDDI
ncbi:hypothetical protein GCM10007383_31150 [Arenibacter certesii]|uniref:General stress protein FMN-binding split barrel domain-containing protein n=1 Tax=Arenibacter certesii TaxID=228955 RepID=A0A918J4W3_9FLAO|nr:hypothetical protein GCM10007383_31150 [Arenibacter certesii]